MIVRTAQGNYRPGDDDAFDDTIDVKFVFGSREDMPTYEELMEGLD